MTEAKESKGEQSEAVEKAVSSNGPTDESGLEAESAPALSRVIDHDRETTLAMTTSSSQPQKLSISRRCEEYPAGSSCGT